MKKKSLGNLNDRIETNLCDSDHDELTIEKNIECSNAIKYILKNWNTFQDWMRSPDGGLGSESSAKQNVTQVKTVLSEISNVGEANLRNLWNKSLLLQYSRSYAVEKHHMPGTIKSYLASIKHFYSFCLTGDEIKLASDNKETVKRMSDTLSRWIKAYKNPSLLEGIYRNLMLTFRTSSSQNMYVHLRQANRDRKSVV